MTNQFDITKHSFNGAKGVYAPNDEMIALSPFGGFDFCTLDKDDAVAIAKHFGLIEEEKERVLKEINSLIKSGPLTGNGTDETAERNGMILIYNEIAS